MKTKFIAKKTILIDYLFFSDKKTLKKKSNDDCPSSVWGSLDSDELYSPCHSYFDTRYIVGTHSSSENVMKTFPSFHGHYKYVS